MTKKSTASAKKDTYFVPDFGVHVEATSAEEAAEIARSNATKEQPSTTPVED